MTVGEATRQYQAALEAERTLRARYEGIVSALDLLDDAHAEVAACERVMFAAWMRARTSG
jgi:hypothetical protein